MSCSAIFNQHTDGHYSQFGLTWVRTAQAGLAVWTLVTLDALAHATLALSSPVADSIVEGPAALHRLLTLTRRALVAFKALTGSTFALAIS